MFVKKFVACGALVFAATLSSSGAADDVVPFPIAPIESEIVEPETLESLAVPSEAAIFENFKMIGETRFRVMWLRIYDAELRTSGDQFSWDEPFALSLVYARDITASRLVNSSLQEIAKNTGTDPNELEVYRPALERCFPSVLEDDRITGFADPEGISTFFLNGEKHCQVDEPGFQRAFFGIWLGDQTRDDDKSRDLRGLAR